MININMFFKGLYKILFMLPKLNMYVKNKEKYSLEERYDYVRKMVHIFFKASGYVVNYEGIDNFDLTKPNLITPNHQSFVDSFALIALANKPIFIVAKSELKKTFIIGKAIDAIDGIYLERDNIKESVKLLIKVKEKLEEGYSVVIFPEGTRTKDENQEFSEFKAGSFKPAIQTKSLVLPVLIDGSYKMNNQKAPKKDRNFKITFLKPIKTDKYENNETIKLAEIVSKKLKDLKDKK